MELLSSRMVYGARTGSNLQTEVSQQVRTHDDTSFKLRLCADDRMMVFWILGTWNKFNRWSTNWSLISGDGETWWNTSWIMGYLYGISTISIIIYIYKYWLVVWNMSYFPCHIWDVILPIDWYFSDGLKPPTSHESWEKETGSGFYQQTNAD